MSTKAQVELINRNKKAYHFWITSSGYPSGVVSDLPDEEMDFEDVRRALRLVDDPEDFESYYYSISLVDHTIEIYDKDRSSGSGGWGELLFRGTFAEAKQEFLEEW